MQLNSRMRQSPEVRAQGWQGGLAGQGSGPGGYLTLLRTTRLIACDEDKVGGGGTLRNETVQQHLRPLFFLFATRKHALLLAWFQPPAQRPPSFPPLFSQSMTVSFPK